MSNREQALKVTGVSRDAESPGGKSLLIAFNRKPTDDELRHIHDTLAALQPTEQPTSGKAISVDVSTGDHDAGHRIFAELTGEAASDGALIAIETGRNFSTEQPEAAQDELSKAADRVVIANATGNPDLYRDAVADLLKAVRLGALLAGSEQGRPTLANTKPCSAGERALIQAACSRHYPHPSIDQSQAFEAGWAECRAAVERKQGDAICLNWSARTARGTRNEHFR